MIHKEVQSLSSEVMEDMPVRGSIFGQPLEIQEVVMLSSAADVEIQVVMIMAVCWAENDFEFRMYHFFVASSPPVDSCRLAARENPLRKEA